MRQAIISDIHGNIEALEAVVADIQTQNIQEVVCLGDIVGYGPDPIPCVDEIRKQCPWTVCGNHDAALFMSVPVGFNPLAAKAIQWHKTRLKPVFFLNFAAKKRWRFLENLEMNKIILPNTREATQYVHGSPRDYLFEYIEETDVQDLMGPTQKMKEIFESQVQLCFVGHSHKPGIVTDNEFVWHKPDTMEQLSWKVNRDVKTLVNIGSVGQPRDGNPNSCYVIYDTQDDRVTFRRVAYDVQKTKKKFVDHPYLHPRLGDRLEVGR